jgi:hypothetical protein
LEYLPFFGFLYSCSFLVDFQIFFFCFVLGASLYKEKHDEFMLRELVRRWSNHKVMVALLSLSFQSLDQYFTPRRSLPALDEVGRACFHDRVFLQVPQMAPYLAI